MQWARKATKFPQKAGPRKTIAGKDTAMGPAAVFPDPVHPPRPTFVNALVFRAWALGLMRGDRFRGHRPQRSIVLAGVRTAVMVSVLRWSSARASTRVSAPVVAS